MKELPKQKCIICKREFEGFGANPEPVYPIEKGKCCPTCDGAVVLPIRIMISRFCDEAIRNEDAYIERANYIKGMYQNIKKIAI